MAWIAIGLWFLAVCGVFGRFARVAASAAGLLFIVAQGSEILPIDVSFGFICALILIWSICE